jgi:hypothetical protein
MTDVGFPDYSIFLTSFGFKVFFLMHFFDDEKFEIISVFFFHSFFFLLVGKSEYLCCHLIFNVDFLGLFYFGRVFGVTSLC